MKRLKRRAREVFEHHPHELHVAVNGYVQCGQKVNSELSEISLTLSDDELPNFIEVFGQYWTRLLLMPVDVPPPEGPLQQILRVELSEQRSLELSLKFGSPWPTLQVTYYDPTFITENA